MTIFSILVAAGLSTQPDVQYELQDPSFLGGLGANLSYARGTLRIGSEMVAIRDCASTLFPGCIISSYFILAVPAIPADRWMLQGAWFTPTQLSHVATCVAPHGARIIHSQQEESELSFFWSGTDGLLGWSISYPHEGTLVAECWLRANNSFKPKPLRGSA